ncbi:MULTISPECIES: (deoxy)nucleoside triphosphate pyrophosphohydrolase [Catenuloplanes]|uniref:8-oxo-dGTP diphosphatase n=1 Tax=Catenuloplanes niger TaxID=587534 RepID=A0AAE3ZTC3_9ACTN|nr:(deoxy)nucleoside triphosphate pyrophosphohydrolase [Catenuloplanes niger]MDR7324365.1 8-oxo-dGTP diphosphatase [Catenuloplanes niger]
MYTERARSKVVVGAAILSGGRVLACARSAPPEVAGRFEFPGGKVEPGESETDAVARECAEELGITVRPGARLGVDVPLGNGWAVLRVYLAELVGDAQPRALEHRELRWLAVDELDSVPWLPADVPIVEALRAHLTAAG